MSIDHDETMSRAPQVGTLIHEAIGLLLAQTMSPTPAQILRAAHDSVDRFPRVEGLSHRQNIAAGTSAYFARLLPPPQWLFHGHEVHLGHGRLDLVWVDFQDRILIDEVKCGGARSLHVRRTRDQVEAYRVCAAQTWGNAFAGLRLLSTLDPGASLLVSPDGRFSSLSGSGLVRGAS